MGHSGTDPECPIFLLLQYIPVDTNKVEQASEQDEDVEDFMKAPVFKLEEFWLESINNAANCICNTTKDKVYHPACP